jgi:hypothetical protein
VREEKYFRELYDDDARLEILIFHKNIFYYVICMAKSEREREEK